MFAELLESEPTLLPARSVGFDVQKPQQSKKSFSWTSMKVCLPLWGCNAHFLSLKIQGEIMPQIHLHFFFFFFVIEKWLMIQRIVGRQKFRLPSIQSPLKKIYRYYLLNTNVILVYCIKIKIYRIYKGGIENTIRDNQCVSLTWGPVCLFLTKMYQGKVFRQQLRLIFLSAWVWRLRLASHSNQEEQPCSCRSRQWMSLAIVI